MAEVAALMSAVRDDHLSPYGTHPIRDGLSPIQYGLSLGWKTVKPMLRGVSPAAKTVKPIGDGTQIAASG